MSRPGLTDLGDAELLRIYRDAPDEAGGRAAISELFRRYRDRLYLWCLRHMGEHEAALDLSQETLLAAFRALPTFEGRSGFASWLFAIARFRCISALRTPRLTLDDGVSMENVAGSEPGPEDEFLAREDEDRSLALLERVLDPAERQAIWLRCYEGLPVEEITNVLNLTEKSGARGVIQRARRKLRAALETEESGSAGGRS